MLGRCLSAIVALIVPLMMATGGLLLAPPAPALAAETAGTAYVIDEICCGGHGGVIRVDTTKSNTPAGNNQTIVSEGNLFGDPTGAVLDPVHDVLYVADFNCCGGTGGVIKVDLTNPDKDHNQTVVAHGHSFVHPFGIVLDQVGNLDVVDLTCCTSSHGGVIQVNPNGTDDGTNQHIIAQGGSFSNLVGIALDKDGTLYVADLGCCTGGHGGVIKVDPSQPIGSNQTIVSEGQNFAQPAGVTVAADGTLYVTDKTCCHVNTNFGAVIHVDPTQDKDHNQTLTSDGEGFLKPTGIALGFGSDLFVVDQQCCANAHGALLAVDLTKANGSNQFLISDGITFSRPIAVAVVPQVSIADATVTEGTGTNVPMNFTITRDPWSPLPLSIDTLTASGTAIAGTDFDLPVSSVVTFAAGQTTTTQTYQVGGDAIAEPTETFTVALQALPGLAITRATATGTILDNDSPATLNIADTSATEGNSGTTNAVFTITLSNPSSQTVTVHTATSDGTATVADGDYVAGSGTVTFAPGDTSKQIAVVVNGDTKSEPDETFTATLSSPTGGAVLGKATATGTITNDDGAPSSPTLSIADTSVKEGDSGTTNAVFTIALSPASSQTVTVHTATSDGAATVADGDYVAGSGTVTFAPGDTSKQIAVVVNGDTKPEPDETFTVTLSSPTGGAVLGKATATGTIQNDDTAPATPSLNIADVSVPEGNSGSTPANFTVTLIPASTQVVTVQFSTLSATAIEGQDYTATSGMLTFQPGDTSKSFTVQVTGDTTFEDDETFQVFLSNPTGGAVIGRNEAYGKIVNDDVAGPCGPRPAVTQTVTILIPGENTLAVVEEATPLNGGGANSLSAVAFGTIENAIVTVNSHPVSSGQVIALPTGTEAFSFVVRRATAGVPVSVPFIVTDGCGIIRKFVGAGAAGF